MITHISFILLLAFPIVVHSLSWQELLEQKKEFLSPDCYNLVMRQHQAHQEGIVPTIAAPEIKQIPIEENGEYLATITCDPASRIRMRPLPQNILERLLVLVPDYNAADPCAYKVRFCVAACLTAMLQHLDHLAPHFGYEPGQLEIIVIEGLRDIRVQEAFFNKKMEQLRKADPTLTEEEAEKEASKWVSPVKNNVPPYSTGGAITLRLYDKNSPQEEYLDCGECGVMGKLNQTAPIFSEELTDAQKTNRLLLLAAATEALLTNYPYEWWNYSFGDRYAIFWREQDAEKRKALYGAFMQDEEPSTE